MSELEELEKKIEAVEASQPIKSKTDLIFNQKAKEEQSPTILNTFWDIMGLEKAMETKYITKIEEVKVNYFKFFILGVIFAYISVFSLLYGIGIYITWQQMAQVIFGFIGSVGFAFIWGKFKEAVPIIFGSDPDKLKGLLVKIVKKLS